MNPSTQNPCESHRLEYSAWSDGERQLAAEAVEHLAECESCQSFVSFARSSSALMRQAGPQMAPHGTSNPIPLEPAHASARPKRSMRSRLHGVSPSGDESHGSAADFEGAAMRVHFSREAPGEKEDTAAIGGRKRIAMSVAALLVGFASVGPALQALQGNTKAEDRLANALDALSNPLRHPTPAASLSDAPAIRVLDLIMEDQ